MVIMEEWSKFNFQTMQIQNYRCRDREWRSQDEPVTWAQHGHTQFVRNTHLLGDLGHAPATKNKITLWDHF